MQFAKFAGEDGKTVFINPTQVTSVRELNERLCLVACGKDVMNVPLPINVVISDLEAALRR
jgi:hypothetical protein